MTDQQIVSIAITLFAIATGSIFNNVRISDSNNRFDKRFDDLRDLINSHHAAMSEKVDRIEQTLSAVIGDHEKRLRDLEHK